MLRSMEGEKAERRIRPARGVRRPPSWPGPLPPPPSLPPPTVPQQCGTASGITTASYPLSATCRSK